MEKRYLSGALHTELRAAEPDAETPENGDLATTDTTSAKDSKAKVIKGYAIRFEEPSKDLGGFVEVVDPAALDGVDLSNVVMLFNHDYSQPLATVKAGTLKLTVDDGGLYFEATLSDGVTYSDDLYKQIQAGNVDSCSFGFDIDDGSDEWEKDGDQVTRVIKQVKNLFDISAVTVPAYDATSVDTRSYNKFIKGNTTNMTEKTLLQTPEKTETRAYEDFIRSHGETRDGLTTQGASAVIPQEVVTPIFKTKVGHYGLVDFATVKNVSTGQGSYPIATNDPTKYLATKEERAEMEDADSGIKPVAYATTTKAGRVYLSQEVLDDSAVDLVKEVQEQLQNLVENTDNHNIIEKLKTLDVTPVTSLDDIKAAKNTKLDPALTPIVIVGQTGFNWLDTLKDSDGRYILQPDVTAPFGKTLFGYPVVVVSDAILPANGGKLPMFIGDLSETIAVFNRLNVNTEWTAFDSYSEGLAVVLRNSYEFISKNAMLHLELTPAVADTKTAA